MRFYETIPPAVGNATDRQRLSGRPTKDAREDDAIGFEMLGQIRNSLQPFHLVR